MSPIFDAFDPWFEPVAAAYWELATACTGFEPAVGVVRIEDTPSTTSHAGFRDGTLRAVVLSQGDREGVIAHEIAHAWSHAPPAFVSEGLAELLVDCMARKDGRVLETRWGVQPQHQALADMRFENPKSSADYEAAEQFFRAAEAVLPEGALWRPDLTLASLRAGLERDPRGVALLEVLDADLERQRAELADDDRDGLAVVHERVITHTDPTRFDTDGDGLADGVTSEVRGLALPLDRRPHCGPDWTWVPRHRHPGVAIGGVPMLGSAVLEFVDADGRLQDGAGALRGPTLAVATRHHPIAELLAPTAILPGASAQSPDVCAEDARGVVIRAAGFGGHAASALAGIPAPCWTVPGAVVVLGASGDVRDGAEETVHVPAERTSTADVALWVAAAMHLDPSASPRVIGRLIRRAHHPDSPLAACAAALGP